MMPVTGNAWIFGDDLNTDVIHPPEFFSLDQEKVKRGLFHGLDPTLQPRIRPGDILIAGRNFGCGSSRETSVQSLKLNRIGAIIAIDFARIFFRNATNNALRCLTFVNPDDQQRIQQGQRLEVRFDDWILMTETGEHIELERAGSFVKGVWEAGGLLEMLNLADRV